MRCFICASIGLFPSGIHATRRGIDRLAGLVVESRSFRKVSHINGSNQSFEIGVSHGDVVDFHDVQGNQSGVDNIEISSFANDFTAEQGEVFHANSFDNVVEDFNVVQNPQIVDHMETDFTLLQNLSWKDVHSRRSTFASASFLQTPPTLEQKIREATKKALQEQLEQEKKEREDKVNQLVLPPQLAEQATPTKWLGEGGFADVYLLEADDDANQFAALKVISVSQGNSSNALIQREIDLLRKMKNDYVTCLVGPVFETIDDADDGEFRKLLIMPYMNSGDLSEWIHKKRSSREMNVVFWSHAVKGVAYLHSKGVIHKDIKPENVLIHCKKGACAAAVSDLGLACESKDWRTLKIFENPCPGIDQKTADGKIEIMKCVNQFIEDVIKNSQEAENEIKLYKPATQGAEKEDVATMDENIHFFEDGDIFHSFRDKDGLAYTTTFLRFGQSNFLPEVVYDDEQFKGESPGMSLTFYKYDTTCQFGGTPSYVSPAAISRTRKHKGRRNGNPADDLWALGVMLFEIATKGQTLPWEQLAKDWMIDCQARLRRKRTLAKTSRWAAYCRRSMQEEHVYLQTMMNAIEYYQAQLEVGKTVMFRRSARNADWSGWEGDGARGGDNKLNFDIGDTAVVSEKRNNSEGEMFFSIEGHPDSWAPSSATLTGTEVLKVLDGRFDGAELLKRLITLAFDQAAPGDLMKMMPEVVKELGREADDRKKYEDMINLKPMCAPPDCLQYMTADVGDEQNVQQVTWNCVKGTVHEWGPYLLAGWRREYTCPGTKEDSTVKCCKCKVWRNGEKMKYWFEAKDECVHPRGEGW